MITTIGIFIEFILVMLLMGYFIIYTRAKVNAVAYRLQKKLELSQEEADKTKKYSGIWHGLGLAMRLVFIGIVFFEYWGQWYEAVLYTMISIFLSWTVFDRGINVVMKNDFFYTDSKNINKFLGKLYWILTIALMVGIILWAILGNYIIQLF